MTDCTCKIHSPATPPEDVHTRWHQGGWREPTSGCPVHDPEDATSQPPDRIWLQWHGDEDPDTEMGRVSERAVTWCRDQVFDRDVQYVRADTAQERETIPRLDDWKTYSPRTDEERRAIRMGETSITFPREKDVRNLPSILRLGAGHESSLATKIMRAAADEIENLRAEVERWQTECFGETQRADLNAEAGEAHSEDPQRCQEALEVARRALDIIASPGPYTDMDVAEDTAFTALARIGEIMGPEHDTEDATTVAHGETCEVCGRRYPFAYLAAGDLWQCVTGQEDGKWCPDCFNRAAEEKGLCNWNKGRGCYWHVTHHLTDRVVSGDVLEVVREALEGLLPLVPTHSENHPGHKWPSQQEYRRRKESARIALDRINEIMRNKEANRG